MADSSYASVVETRQESSSNSPPTIDKTQVGNSWKDGINSTLQRRGQHWQTDPALTANTQQGRNIWSSSTSATSSCYLPRGVNDMPSYGSSASSMNNQHIFGSIGDSRLGPHQKIGGNFHRQHDDFSSDSMMNSRIYNNQKNNFHYHHDHLAASLGQLNLYEGGDDVSNAGTSLNSMTSTSIPGVVGVITTMKVIDMIPHVKGINVRDVPLKDARCLNVNHVIVSLTKTSEMLHNRLCIPSILFIMKVDTPQNKLCILGIVLFNTFQISSNISSLQIP